MLGHLNLDIRPIKSRREVDHIIELKRDYFTAHIPSIVGLVPMKASQATSSRIKRSVLLSRRGKSESEIDQTQLWVIHRNRTF